MNETEFLERWAKERPMYEAWGSYVVSRIVEQLSPKIAPMSVDIFLRIPPKFRIKTESSLLEKAFYRKRYKDPFDDVTDKVGVRFVVLLNRDLNQIAETLESCREWNWSKDRDFEEEQKEHPIAFDYAALHYVIRCGADLKVDEINIPTGTPCEVQIKTILQHAYSELTHDTVYKPKVETTPLMLRNAAKSAALIEATNDYFERVVDQVAELIGNERAITEAMTNIYRKKIEIEPTPSRLEGLILDSYPDFITDDTVSHVEKMMDEKKFIAQSIRNHARINLVFRQPSILLLYLIAMENPSQMKQKWPLTYEELRPIYIDLGLNFDNF